MRVNEKYLQRMYVAFGREARENIRDCVNKIIATLEEMSEGDRDAILSVLDPEVRKAIVEDWETEEISSQLQKRYENGIQQRRIL